ncbi:MAG: tRNA lysidine(34) synthetase TilS [Planctomycetaceae bacterium]|jgi:tRNA(Ile)-lysidine synthase|nr:tRNA lysidine(34) synthetase TilS [Planctomycetaceae bacterium]
MISALSGTLPITLPPLHHGVVAAVSGGADSTAMLLCLAEQLHDKSKLAVAHINHNLRGKESDEDAAFVQQLACVYQLRYCERCLEVPRTLSEEAARKIRYNYLTDISEELGFRYLAVAHNADDQTETVLHRILRGTGLSGLAGIAPMRQLTPAVTLIRPLINIRRKDITAFLQSAGQEYRTDSTNQQNTFTRNRIRNRLLPLLRKKFNPQIDNALCKLARLSAENESVQNDLLDSVLDFIVTETHAHRIVLNTQQLKHYLPETQRAIFVRLWKRFDLPLQAMTFEHWLSLVDFIQSAAGYLEMPGSVQVAKEHQFLTVMKNSRC